MTDRYGYFDTNLKKYKIIMPPSAVEGLDDEALKRLRANYNRTSNPAIWVAKKKWENNYGARETVRVMRFPMYEEQEVISGDTSETDKRREEAERLFASAMRNKIKRENKREVYGNF